MAKMGLYIPQEILSLGKLSGNQRMILALIADIGDDCFATKRFIAERVFLHENTVLRCIKVLVSAGMLIQVSRKVLRTPDIETLHHIHDNLPRNFADKRKHQTDGESHKSGGNKIHKSGGSQTASLVVHQPRHIIERIKDSNHKKSELPTELGLVVEVSGTEKVVPKKPVPAKEPKAPKPRDEFYDKLAEITASDPKLVGQKIGVFAARLKKAGYDDVNHLKRFALWWWDKYRKQKGDFPSLETVVSKISQVIKFYQGSTTPVDAPIDPEEMSTEEIMRRVDKTFSAAFGQSSTPV
jgi:hypothetical protein